MADTPTNMREFLNDCDKMAQIATAFQIALQQYENIRARFGKLTLENITNMGFSNEAAVKWIETISKF